MAWTVEKAQFDTNIAQKGDLVAMDETGYQRLPTTFEKVAYYVISPIGVGVLLVAAIMLRKKKKRR